jgi:hypothetical protein
MNGKSSAGFHYIAWAREVACQCHTRGDAHVLLYLATRANDEGEAWPSLGTTARECGLRVKADKAKGASSSVSGSLKRLRKAGLIETTQRGAQRASVHRLLAPATSSTTDGPTSAIAEQNYQENCHYTDAGITSVTGLPSERTIVNSQLPKGHPPERKTLPADGGHPLHRGRRWTEAELDAFIAAEEAAA